MKSMIEYWLFFYWKTDRKKMSGLKITRMDIPAVDVVAHRLRRRSKTLVFAKTNKRRRKNAVKMRN